MQHSNNRITFKSLLQEVWHTLTHIEKGLQTTVVALATRPGKMIREYIHGSRKSYQKPFSFLFIVTTLFALLLYWLHYHNEKKLFDNPSVDYNTRFIVTADYLESKFYSWLHIGLLPLYGIISLLIFRQVKYNWAEWMVACCYIISFILLLLIPYQLLNKVFNFNNTANFYIQLLIIISYSNLVMTELVPGKQRLIVILQTLLWCISVFMLFLYTVQFIAWLLTY
ncbi:MAG: DUF3667 domain-containing protein [Chitinophagaceae bacterium]|nr:DUF3667 domain-containing protein [Chitinophagaceae bacterium]